jgi:hypothetical protein
MPFEKSPYAWLMPSDLAVGFSNTQSSFARKKEDQANRDARFHVSAEITSKAFRRLHS